MTLQVIWPGIFVLLVETERAHVAWRCMNETMPNHLILPPETLATWSPSTTFFKVKVRSCVRVNILVAVEQILGLESRSRATWGVALVAVTSKLTVDSIWFVLVRLRGEDVLNGTIDRRLIGAVQRWSRM